MGAIDRLNDTRLSADLLKKLLTILGELPPKDRRDKSARSLAMFSYLQEEDVPGDHAKLLSAVIFRMAALSRLRDQPAFAAWSVKTARAGEPDLLHEALVETAAVHPLVEKGGEPAFEPESFFRAALERSAAQGTA